jgi:hypothetical protein
MGFPSRWSGKLLAVETRDNIQVLLHEGYSRGYSHSYLHVGMFQVNNKHYMVQVGLVKGSDNVGIN